jgi:V8-like Glu-specific endopeptidase
MHWKNTFFQKDQKRISYRGGVYNLKCQNCSGSNIGKTRQSFKVRYDKHVQAIRNNSKNMGYSIHFLNMGHSYGSSKNLEINIQGKGTYVNTLERLHINIT